MKLYDKIKTLLEDNPKLRDYDKELIWTIWECEGLTNQNLITRYQFTQIATSPETIRRTRQRVQQNCINLRSSKGIQRKKDIKQSSKGTFVYREKLSLFNK